MKKKLLFFFSLATAFFSHAQNVGIGTTTPVARLHVKDSSVLFSAAGPVPVTQGNPPVSGDGRRMMWYPDKAAFRAGYVGGTNWDRAYTGDYSASFGINNYASGNSSFATGNGNTASGFSSFSIGQFSTASGNNSTAMGYQTTAAGQISTAMGYATSAAAYSTAMGYATSAAAYSTAMGYGTTAAGVNSTAIGYGTTAKSFVETATGSCNTDYTPLNYFGWNADDRLFVIGNGVDVGSRSDAIVVLKNGNTGIGNSTPGFPLSFASSIGDKVSFWGNTGNHYGVGIQSSLLQIHTDVAISDIAFGYGSSAGFTERMRIQGNGKVGIGISSPNAPLAFANTTGSKISLFESSPNSQYGFAIQGAQLQIYSDNAAAKISFGYYFNGTYTEKMFLNNTTGILTVNGVNYPSDIRLKKDISPLQNPLQKIIQLNGYNYHWKNENSDNKLQTGVLAQEVQKLFPELVMENKEGILAVNYSGLIPVVIESIKEQQKIIGQQQKQIDDLKKLVQQLINK